MRWNGLAGGAASALRHDEQTGQKTLEDDELAQVDKRNVRLPSRWQPALLEGGSESAGRCVSHYSTLARA